VHYKARNFPRSLTETERTEWEVWRAQHIEQQLVQFGAALERVAKRQLTDDDKFVLDELRLWVESIVPEEH
jgi:exodeoxyribonuclease-1